MTLQETVEKFFKKNQLMVMFMLVGAVGGFLYWKLVACNSGICPIKAVWCWSTLSGAIIGYLLGDIVVDMRKKRSGK